MRIARSASLPGTGTASLRVGIWCPLEVCIHHADEYGAHVGLSPRVLVRNISKILSM